MRNVGDIVVQLIYVLGVWSNSCLKGTARLWLVVCAALPAGGREVLAQAQTMRRGAGVSVSFPTALRTAATVMTDVAAKGERGTP